MLQRSPLPLVLQESRGLSGDDQSRNRRGSERRKHARDECGKGKTSDITSSRWSELAKDTDLDTQRADVTESATSVGSNEL